MAEELGRHGYAISPGTLYPLLHDLERQGLVTSHQRTEGGRVLRYYRATPAGSALLAQARHALRELAHELLGSPTMGPQGASDAPG